MADYVRRRNWYACLDPVGKHGNVYFLIPNKVEVVAGKMAQAFAQALDAPMVTLKLIHKR